MFDWLKRLFKYDDEPLVAFDMKTGKRSSMRNRRYTCCPYCKSTEYYEGPTGGVSMNIKCAGCGARFNIGLMPGGPYLMEELSGPEDYRTFTGGDDK